MKVHDAFGSGVIYDTRVSNNVCMCDRCETILAMLVEVRDGCPFHMISSVDIVILPVDFAKKSESAQIAVLIKELNKHSKKVKNLRKVRTF